MDGASFSGFTDPAWPRGLDRHRIPDDALAEAYDAVSAPLRGCIKNTLALAHALYGEGPDTMEHRITDTTRGFSRTTRSTPVPWALAAFTPAYASGPRFAAALMPALLAHVPLVGAVCVGGSPSLSVRVVLELAGVEDAFSLDGGKFARLLRDMMPCGVGRLMLLHTGELASLRRDATALRVPVWEEVHPPRLLLTPGSGHMREYIAWGHPDALWEELSPRRGKDDAPTLRDFPEVDAVYCDAEEEQCFLSSAPLVLLPGMEGCWIHQRLSPHFFTRTATALGTAAPPAPGAL